MYFESRLGERSLLADEAVFDHSFDPTTVREATTTSGSISTAVTSSMRAELGANAYVASDGGVRALAVPDADVMSDQVTINPSGMTALAWTEGLDAAGERSVKGSRGTGASRPRGRFNPDTGEKEFPEGTSPSGSGGAGWPYDCTGMPELYRLTNDMVRYQALVCQAYAQIVENYDIIEAWFEAIDPSEIGGTGDEGNAYRRRLNGDHRTLFSSGGLHCDLADLIAGGLGGLYGTGYPPGLMLCRWYLDLLEHVFMVDAVNEDEARCVILDLSAVIRRSTSPVTPASVPLGRSKHGGDIG